MLKNSKIKLSIYQDERVVIENYLELKEIDEEIIVVDGYQILGSFLHIRKMDDYMIEIIGKITSIILGDQ